MIEREVVHVATATPVAQVGRPTHVSSLLGIITLVPNEHRADPRLLFETQVFGRNPQIKISLRRGHPG
jgi:hypothetical protein